MSGVQVDMDGVNWRILGLLQENARTSFSEIGRQVGLTPTAVAERVRRLEDSGVIHGYRVLVSTSEIGFPITAFVRFAVRPGQSLQLVRLCESLPEILECHRLTGEDSYLMRVVTTSVPHLEQLIDRLLPLGQPTTSIVLSTPVVSKAIQRPAPTASPRRRPAVRGAQDRAAVHAV
jgi:Lrp/AsnC family leucine-responsive transcriptional regulator